MKEYYIYKGTDFLKSFKLLNREKAGSPKAALKKAILGRGYRAGKYLVVANSGPVKSAKVYNITAAEVNRITEAPRGSRSRYYM